MLVKLSLLRREMYILSFNSEKENKCPTVYGIIVFSLKMKQCVNLIIF